VKKGKIVFCFYTRDHEFNFGVGALSAALKQEGYEVDLVVYRDTPAHVDTPEAVVRDIIEKSPMIAAFSVMTLNWLKISKVISLLRKDYEGLIAVGGHHAVLMPEDVLCNSAVDVVCLGEGERPLIELADRATAEGRNVTEDIAGLVFSSRGLPEEPKRQRWLLERLEDYPYLDYDIFGSRDELRRKYLGAMTPAGIFSLPVLTGRGCPYRCTYCNNDSLLSIYGGVGRFVRRYSPAEAIRNIQQLVDKHSPQFFEFFDETFSLDREWIRDFCRRYKKEIDVPFLAMSRIDRLDEIAISSLAESGLKLLFFGLESGDEEYRKKYLKRPISNDAIREGVRLLRKYGVLVGTFNILGMPFETKESLRKTIALNEEIGSDAAIPSVFQPLPRTVLGQIAHEHNMVLPPPGDQWDLCSPALDTEELPASYVAETMEKFREKFSYQNMQNVFAHMRKLVSSS
jgi:anaerobic magnesium-protoporphyrin IX monomethyl ester cyclase